MKRSLFVFAATVMVMLVSVPAVWAAGPVTPIMDLEPAGFLISPDIDGLEFRRSSGFVTEVEEMEGDGSWTPTIRAGIGFNADVVTFDLTGGFSGVYNSAFSGYMVRGEFGTLFEFGQMVRFGPHVGIVRMDLDYEGDADVDLSSETGYLVGMRLTAGRTIHFIANFDYLGMEKMDVEGRNGWVANDDRLDMSGVLVTMGVRLRF